MPAGPGLAAALLLLLLLLAGGAGPALGHGGDGTADAALDDLDAALPPLRYLEPPPLPTPRVRAKAQGRGVGPVPRRWGGGAGSSLPGDDPDGRRWLLKFAAGPTHARAFCAGLELAGNATLRAAMASPWSWNATAADADADSDAAASPVEALKAAASVLEAAAWSPWRENDDGDAGEEDAAVAAMGALDELPVAGSADANATRALAGLGRALERAGCAGRCYGPPPRRVGAGVAFLEAGRAEAGAGAEADATASVRACRAALAPLLEFLERDLLALALQTPNLGAASIRQALSYDTWALDRLDQERLPLDRTLEVPHGLDGRGVSVYVLDTGVRPSHREFAGRLAAGRDFVRSRWGASGVHEDAAGHGSHTAGAAAGSTFGVAKAAAVVPVRVLDHEGAGSWSQVVAGLEWATSAARANRANGRGPAVALLSLGGRRSLAVDAAVRAADRAGLLVVVAAGNDGEDSCRSSPGASPYSFTVTASDRGDDLADFSNWGACVDVVAPGVDILSAWATHDADQKRMSGTSMAAPYAAGAAALVLQALPAASPAEVRAVLEASATPGVLGSDLKGTPNRLLNVAAAADRAAALGCPQGRGCPWHPEPPALDVSGALTTGDFVSEIVDLNNLLLPAPPTQATRGVSQPTGPCAVGSWSEWSACSEECGEGQRMRERSVEPTSVVPVPCPAAVEVELCEGPCAEDRTYVCRFFGIACP